MIAPMNVYARFGNEMRIYAEREFVEARRLSDYLFYTADADETGMIMNPERIISDLSISPDPAAFAEESNR